ncbi:MAG: hypothetical protein RIC56_04040 [Pseudomonadales bacterium]
MARNKLTRRRSASRGPAPLTHPASGSLGIAYARVVEIACRLPGTEESRSYGTPSLKVKGKLLSRLRTEAEGGLAIRCDFVDRHMLMQADPETFYVTDHYLDYPMVLIDLHRVRWDAMPGIIEQGWRLVAAPKLIAELEARHRE